MVPIEEWRIFQRVKISDFHQLHSFSDVLCYRFKTGPPAPGDGPINFFDLAGMWDLAWSEAESSLDTSGSSLTITDDGKPVGSKGKKYGFLIR